MLFTDSFLVFMITSLGDERAGLYVSRAFVCLVRICFFLSFLYSS